MKVAFLVTVAICVVGLNLGCHHQEKSQDQSATTPQPPPPITNPGILKNNRVLSLDGKTASMHVPDTPSLQSLTNGMTLEVWFKAASFYNRSGAVNSFLRKNVDAGGQNFFLRFRIIGGKSAIEMSSGNQIMQALYDFEPDTWYHLAGTYDGKVMSVFVNGVTIRTERFSGPIELDDSDLVIGKGDPNYSFGEYFHGEVDEIRIWNLARSSEQIRATLSARLTGKEPGLVAYWTFDDGTAKDLAGNGNDGVLDGDTRIMDTAAVRPDDALNH